MKRFLILSAVICGLATVGASQSEAGRFRYRGYYSGGYYNAPHYGGYYHGGYQYPAGGYALGVVASTLKSLMADALFQREREKVFDTLCAARAQVHALLQKSLGANSDQRRYGPRLGSSSAGASRPRA